MADTRLLIAVTPEQPVADEGRKIEALLRAGWHRVHLRHPQASRVDMRNIIESIRPEYHCRLVLHGHFDLIYDFNLGGLHLNHRCPAPPARYNGALSRSCHSMDEIAAMEVNGESRALQYVTLSPIFDSISKSGYQSAFTPEALQRLDGITTPVIALGGIRPEHFDVLNGYNFSGYAMLGAIPWSGTSNEVIDFATQCVTHVTQQ